MAEGMRIGDSERDQAVSLLQEHHAAGRLSTEEFDERMGKALEARTGADLEALFRDLPGGGPRFDPPSMHGTPYGAPSYGTPSYGTPTYEAPTYGAPSYEDPYGIGSYGDSNGMSPYQPQPQPVVPPYESQQVEQNRLRPWYTQWWAIVGAIFLIGSVSSRAWTFVPLVVIFFVFVFPYLKQRRALQGGVAATRPLTAAERDEVMRVLTSRPMIDSASEIMAIRRYREITGADLATAAQAVKGMRRELGS